MNREKLFVLTGACGSIGRAMSTRIIQQGHHLVAIDMYEDGLNELKRAYGDKISIIHADVSNESCQTAIQKLLSSMSMNVDVLINNAGVYPRLLFSEMNYEDWSKVIQINLDSVFLVTKATLPYMNSKWGGRIINVGSTSVSQGTAGFTHYVAAKAGIVGFSRSLARELGPKGITVNVIALGLTITEAVKRVNSYEFIESRRNQRSIPRDQHPDDILGCLMFIASDESDFVSGQTLIVDGGGTLL